MAIRNVNKSFTFELQRQEINSIGADVGDAATLNTTSKVVVTAINNILSGSEPFTGNLTVNGDLTVKGGDIIVSDSATNISIIDNSSSSLVIKEGSNAYLTFDTTNGSENITLFKTTNLSATADFKVNTNKFTVTASTGNTLVAGTLDSTGDFKVNTNKFTVTALTGNTSIAGTLGVTDNVTLNKNVTMVGSDTASTEYFKIQNGSAVDKFVVDSSSGDTTISGAINNTTTLGTLTNLTTVTQNTLVDAINEAFDSALVFSILFG